MNDPKFPVLYVGPHGIDAFGSMSTASIVGASFIEEKWWSERQLIDSEGTTYNIIDIEIIGNGSWWPQVLTLPARRIYQVQYRLQEADRLNLEQVKALVIRKLRTSREPWKYIEECNSIEKIIESIGVQP